MRVARRIGLGLTVVGAVLGYVGVATPCLRHPVTPAQYGAPSCGGTLLVAVVGFFVLATGILLLIADRTSNRTPGILKRLGGVLGASAVVLLAVLATLALAPIHESFTMHDLKIRDAEATCSGIDTVKGTTVSFQWWAASNVTFGAWSCSANALAYSATGTNGSGSLVSHGGLYEFGTACAPAGNPTCVGSNITGSYSGPFLEI